MRGSGATSTPGRSASGRLQTSSGAAPSPASSTGGDDLGQRKTDSVLRYASPRKWGTIPLAHLDDDSRLSWKACGILDYLLTRPDGWDFYLNDIITRHRDKRDSCRSGLKELKACGYLRLKPRSEGGWTWWVSEHPLDEDQWAAVMDPKGGKPAFGKPVNGKPVDTEGNINQQLTLTGASAGRAQVDRAGFDELWALHPRGKKDAAGGAWDAYKKAIRSGVEHATMEDGLRDYVRREVRPDFKGVHLFRWIRDRRWEEQADQEDGDLLPEVGTPEWAAAEAARMAQA